jgi:hypothetical protein
MIFIDNKYTRWYYRIITTAKNRILPKNIYTERHHIIPRSLGGNNLKDNLVKLTAREHFVCHLLLVKMTKDSIRHKMLSAVTKFRQSRSYQNRTLNSWEYKKLRECAILARKGIQHTDEARQKIKDKHHDVSGSNNPRAKFIKAVSPNGTVHTIHGGLKKFCKENGLGYSTVHIILSTNKKFKGSTEGWLFSYI